MKRDISWEDQGRQEHGWFGNGTAPAVNMSSEGRAATTFDPANAAQGVSHADLAKASADLAGEMQAIGLYNWPSFLRDAADRAETYQPAQSPIVLAQVTTPNTATDASPGAALGSYVASNPEQ